MRRTWWMGIALAILAIPAWGGPGFWTPVGGPMAPSSKILVDPARPGTLYAISVLLQTDSGALWKSTDGGASWSSLQTGVGFPVALLAIDPRQTDRLYAWSRELNSTRRLWASEDGGATWELRFAVPANRGRPDFAQLVPSPLASGVLYGLAAGGAENRPTIYRSTDGGATWERRGQVGYSGDDRGFTGLLHDPERDLLYFFGKQGLARSADGGRTWTLQGRFQGAGFTGLVQAPASPQTFYAFPCAPDNCGLRIPLLRSDDRGATWRRTGLPRFIGRQPYVSEVAVDLHDAQLVRLVVNGIIGDRYVPVLYTSRDGGRTWSVGRRLPALRVLPLAEGGDTLYADADSSFGVEGPAPFKSIDGGLTWVPAFAGIAAGDLRGSLLALPASGGKPVLFGASGGGLARSRDAGITWAPLSLANAQSPVADAAPGLLYALGSDVLYRSRDSGDHWIQTPLPARFSEPLLADPFQSGRLFTFSYVDDTQVIVWRSADGGTTWGQRGAGLPVRCVHYASVDYCPRMIALTSDPRDTGLVLMAFESFVFPEGYLESRVYRSLDGGLHWQSAMESPTQLLALEADPSRRGTFLAGTAEGVYRSADGGEHWAPSSSGLPAHVPVVQLLWNGRAGAWYAVTERQGIFRSADGGLTWTPFASGLPDSATPRLALDPRVPERLFAAVRGQGVWSWKAVP